MLVRTLLAGKGQNRRLTIGHSSSISAGYLHTTLDMFRQSFPDVDASMVGAPCDIPLAGLNAYIVDLVIMSDQINREDLRSERVWDERLMAGGCAV